MITRRSELLGIDYQIPNSRNTLSTSLKMEKSAGEGYLQSIIYLAPAEMLAIWVKSLRGHFRNAPNLCLGSVRNGCQKPCLNLAGMGAFNTTQRARLNRSAWYVSDTRDFLAATLDGLEKLRRRADKLGLIPAVRPDGTQCIPALRSAVFAMARRVGVRAWGYSGNPAEAWRYLDTNTPVTLSRKGPMDDAECKRFLAAGGNVSVVFYEGLPSRMEWHGFPVVDGDEHDVRLPELDGRGVVVGLRLKRTTRARMAAAVESGFAIA